MHAYDSYGARCVVHIDAHIDLQDERDGVREGYSSTLAHSGQIGK
jgi:arginase family enzyme